MRKSETCSQSAVSKAPPWPLESNPHRSRRMKKLTTIQSVTGSFLIDLKHQNKTSTQIDSDGFFYSLFLSSWFWRGGLFCFFFFSQKVSSSESLICKQTVKSLTAKSSNSREGKSIRRAEHVSSLTVSVSYLSVCQPNVEKLRIPGLKRYQPVSRS